MTERIDHAAEAAKVAKPLENDPYTSRAQFLAEAQLHATLALVEQQRIANLISLWQGSPVKDEYIGAGEQALLTAPGMVLRPEIAAALGIETGEER